jgi:hypothetical protein
MKTNPTTISNSNAASPLQTIKLLFLALMAVVSFAVAIYCNIKPDFLPTTLDGNGIDSSIWQQSKLANDKKVAPTLLKVRF